MSRFHHYEPCPRCRENGRDSRGDNLGVYSDGGAHCYSCGYHKFPLGWWRLTEDKVDHVDENEKVLPSDFSREIPAKAWQWVLKFGLGYRYWQEHCGYSEKDRRLIFTVRTGDKDSPVAFSIGRLFEEASTGTDPQRSPRKWYAYGNCHEKAHVVGDYTKSEKIVLVEDLISAHKVGQVCPCIPLFGTRIFDGVIQTLRYIGLPIVLWLDYDQQGNIVKKAHNLSCLINQPVSYIFTEKDPKENSFQEIKELLNDV